MIAPTQIDMKATTAIFPPRVSEAHVIGGFSGFEGSSNITPVCTYAVSGATRTHQ